MIVSHEYRFLYTGPPKTATTSLHTFFGQFTPEGWQALPNTQHTSEIPPGCEDYLRIASWRHPLSRQVSLWAHSQAKPARVHENFPELSFAEFFDWQTAHPERTFYSASQAAWLDGFQVDYWIRFDNLFADVLACPVLEQARRRGHRLVELPWLNTTNHETWSAYYTPELERLVANRFAEDLDLLPQGTRPPSCSEIT